MLTQEFIEECKQKLLKLKVELEERLTRLSPHTELGNGHSEIDEQILEIEDDTVARGMIEEIETRLAKVIKALGKIADGNYGATDDGQPIPKERLGVDPEADTLVTKT